MEPSIQCTALFSAEIEQRLKVHSASRWQLVVFDTDDVLLVGPYSSSSCTTMGCVGRKGSKRAVKERSSETLREVPYSISAYTVYEARQVQIENVSTEKTERLREWIHRGPIRQTRSDHNLEHRH